MATARFCVREYYIDNFAASVDWLAETDDTIFAYQDDDGDGLLNAYDYDARDGNRHRQRRFDRGRGRIARRTLANF